MSLLHENNVNLIINYDKIRVIITDIINFI